MSLRCSHTLPFTVGNAKSLTISITIGFEQAGSTSLRLDNYEYQLPSPGQVKNFVIQSPDPNDDTLSGKILNCRTLVQDIQTRTDNTAVTITLTLGGEVTKFPYQMTVPTNSTVDYEITFFLV